jgi:hypothetical protein
MNASRPQSASADQAGTESPAVISDDTAPSAGFDQAQWEESRSDGQPATPSGRKVLGTGLLLLALLWAGYTAWSAGRALADAPLSSPAIAQWIAIAAGPLALLGLTWLMFGRTGRKEAERFTQSVITMRTEARSLETLLQILSQRINDSRSELTMISQHLMQLGDETTGKLGGITADLDASTDKLKRHGETLDRAAESARIDISVLLEDLPRAEDHARSISQQLRGTASETAARTEQFDRQIAALSTTAREADEIVSAAAIRLTDQLRQVEDAGATAAGQVGEAETSFSSAIESLLDRTSTALDEIRAGVDAQSQAVTALVEQSSVGIGRAGVDASEALGNNVTAANAALETLAQRVAEQERVSQRMVADIDRALGELDQRFTTLADAGDERAGRFLEALGRSRSELEAVGEQSEAQIHSLDDLAQRTERLRDGLDRLSETVREQLGQALQEADSQADRIAQSTLSVRPEIEWIRDAAIEASSKLEQTGSAIAGQQDRLTGLLAALDDGVGGAENRLESLSAAMSKAQAEAAELTARTGPELVEAMVQVREAAAQAAERAREAISAVIPKSAEDFSQATREALERVIRDSIEDRLSDVEAVAARAVESARSATDRLTGQMLALGQSASALEKHVEKQREDSRAADSEAFARRVALLIDSMHSASIDVGKILSDEVDDRAWEILSEGRPRSVYPARLAPDRGKRSQGDPGAIRRRR